MKKFVVAFGLSASLALPLLTPLAGFAATTTAVPNADQLNARLRQELKAPGDSGIKQLPQPKLPTVPLHTEFEVATNRKGQVVKVIAVAPSKDNGFNRYVYYNALQTFIRKTDGSATAGLFKLVYDYSPTTQRIRRDVVFVQAGGVDPNAPSAVEQMERSQHKNAASKGGK